MNPQFIPLLTPLGRAGANEPIYAGTLIFGIVGLTLVYLSFVREEMNPGPVMKVGSILLLVFAVIAFFWPMRPWPH